MLGSIISWFIGIGAALVGSLGIVGLLLVGGLMTVLLVWMVKAVFGLIEVVWAMIFRGY